MQIISMSLGADFGPEDTADAEASEHAAEAGLIVVAAAGNAGQSPYFLGSPLRVTKTLAAAAMDSTATFPGATVMLNTGTKLTAQNNNAAALPGRSLSTFVLPDTAKTGAESVPRLRRERVRPGEDHRQARRGLRGVCGRVNRAIFGQRHGAAAVALINNDPTFGVFEGDIVDPATAGSSPSRFSACGATRRARSAPTRAPDRAASATLAAADIANPASSGLQLSPRAVRATWTASSSRT